MSDTPATPAAATPAATAIDPKQTHAIGEYKCTAPLLNCRFDPSGQFVFASAYDNTIQRWHLASGKATALTGHDSWVRTLAFHPSGSKLYSGGYDGRVIFWDASGETPTAERTIEAHAGWVRWVTVSADGKLLATCGNDNLVKLWNAIDGTSVGDCTGHPRHVYSTAFHPDGRTLFSGDLLGEVREWDVATGEQLRHLDAKALWKYDKGFGADIGGVRSMTFSADGKLLACAGITEVSNAFAGIGHPLIVVLDVEAGTTKQSLVSSAKLQAPATGVRFHPGGFLIGSCGGGGGGYLLFWKLDDAKEFFSVKVPDVARDFDLHPDQSRLATAHDDTKLRLWQMTAKA